MKASDLPKKPAVAFASSGQKNSIPDSTSSPGAASYSLGFPPVTMNVKEAGGIPPSGMDMNGILNEISLLTQWFTSGGPISYDASYSASVGGYPKGAVIMGNDSLTAWRSNVDDNTTDPNSGGVGWVKVAEDIKSILGLGTASTRDVGIGSNQIPDMSSYEMLLDANSKFRVKLPNSFVLQSVQSLVPQASQTSGLPESVNIDFQQPFPTKIIGCWASVLGGDSVDSAYHPIVSAQSVNNSTIKLISSYTASGLTVVGYAIGY